MTGTGATMTGSKTTLTFRDAPTFVHETLAVTGAAAAAGLLAAVVGGEGALGLPLSTMAASAAVFGGSVAAALTRSRPRSSLRAFFGIVGGACAAFVLAVVSAKLPYGFFLMDAGAVLGGAIGGLAIGSLLGAEETRRPRAHAVGIAAAGVTGAVGAVALERAAAFATSEAASTFVSLPLMAAAAGLWSAAAAGARRLERPRDALVEAAEALLQALAEPCRSKLKDGLEAWREIERSIAQDAAHHGTMRPETADDAKAQARRLFESMLETARSWKQIHVDAHSPRVQGLDEKLAAFEQRLSTTSDAVTQSHLQRAMQALRQQQAAVAGLRVGCGRAEAALDAQAALLERLRLAVAQHRISDRERFAVEVSAIADQAARLTDDLDALSAAVAEAEALQLTDRRALADFERSARRTLADDIDASVEASAVEAVQVERKG
jgi:hypothetical protein